MRMHLLTLSLLACLLNAPAAAGEPSGFWHPDYETAAGEARTSGRALLIHFYADWCGPCRQMEARVLNQKTFADALDDRVAAVKVNYDRRGDLVSRYDVRALPCDLLVDADGNVLMRTTGFVAEAAYVEQIEQLAPEIGSMPSGALLASLTTTRQIGGVQDLGAVRHVGWELIVVSGR